MFSSGIDSVSFCIPKAQLLKFLQKHNLYARLRLTNRNAQVREYINQKFKDIDAKHSKYKMRVRYINITPRVKSLSNTILVFENIKQTHSMARANKKSLDYFVLVTLAGLHQPSKNVDKATHRILSLFLRRFSLYSLDLAFDFLGKEKVTPKKLDFFKDSAKEYVDDASKAKSAHTTLYLNSLKEFYKIDKMLWYDKFHKQRFFHNERLPDSLQEWQRLEIRFVVKKKFYKWFDDGGLDDGIDILSKVAKNIGACKTSGINVAKLGAQVAGIFDLRKIKSFKKMF